MMTTTIEHELEIEANTIECCIVCGRTRYLNEMSECVVHGHFCGKCDCPCLVLSEDAA